MKRTAAETRRYIEQLEAEVVELRKARDENAEVDAFAAEMYGHVDFMPKWPRSVGDGPKTVRDHLEEALLDLVAEYWNEHAVNAVFELCAIAGQRSSSRAPGDIAEAAESLVLRGFVLPSTR